MALAELFAADGLTAAVDPLALKMPHFAPKAKNIIFMFMEGGPSQYELFDPKPELERWDGQSLPESITKDLRLPFIKPSAKVMANRYKFQPHGKSGMELSELAPHLGSVADDICLVRSMHSDSFNHHPGQLLLFTGAIFPGRPTLGSWLLYGLGSESKNLPGFVVLTSGKGTSGGTSNFSSGFLPSHFQGTPLRNQGDPILFLKNPPGVTQESQRETISFVNDMNRIQYEKTGDEEIASRMNAYELAFRMQVEAPDLIDLSGESRQTLKMYGVDSDNEHRRQYATNCLLARRLVERGVRTVLMMDASWDDHTYLNEKLPKHWDEHARDRPANSSTDQGPQAKGTPRRDVSGVGWRVWTDTNGRDP